MGCRRARWVTGGTVRRCRQGRDGKRLARSTRWSVDGRAAVAGRVRAAQAGVGGGDGAAADLAEGCGVHRSGPFADLEALRVADRVSVSRFAVLAGIAERTYWRRLARHRAGNPVKGPWPAPRVSMRRCGLLLPVGYRADRRSWTRLRRRVFHDPPRERNRVWQTDFSEFETTSGGIWRICAVIDYATKYCLATTVTPTARGWTRWRACVARSPKRSGSPAWRICGSTAGRWTSSMQRGWSSARCRLRSRWSPTTGRVFAVGCSPRRSPATIRCCGTCGPGQESADQRRGRTVLRHAEIRAPLPRDHRRRRRPRRGGRPVPAHLQHSASAPSAQRLHTTPGLPAGERIMTGPRVAHPLAGGGTVHDAA
jgi:hypothetical protein